MLHTQTTVPINDLIRNPAAHLPGESGTQNITYMGQDLVLVPFHIFQAEDTDEKYRLRLDEPSKGHRKKAPAARGKGTQSMMARELTALQSYLESLEHPKSYIRVVYHGQRFALIHKKQSSDLIQTPASDRVPSPVVQRPLTVEVQEPNSAIHHQTVLVLDAPQEPAASVEVLSKKQEETELPINATPETYFKTPVNGLKNGNILDIKPEDIIKNIEDGQFGLVTFFKRPAGFIAPASYEDILKISAGRQRVHNVQPREFHHNFGQLFADRQTDPSLIRRITGETTMIYIGLAAGLTAVEEGALPTLPDELRTEITKAMAYYKKKEVSSKRNGKEQTLSGVSAKSAHSMVAPSDAGTVPPVKAHFALAAVAALGNAFKLAQDGGTHTVRIEDRDYTVTGDEDAVAALRLLAEDSEAVEQFDLEPSMNPSQKVGILSKFFENADRGLLFRGTEENEGQKPVAVTANADLLAAYQLLA